MTAIAAGTPDASPRRPGPLLFGVPIGGLGLFASLIIAGALGLIAFFLATFVSIFGLLIYNHASGRHIPLDASYKLIAAPVGMLVLAASLVSLLLLWLRRRAAS